MLRLFMQLKTHFSKLKNRRKRERCFPCHTEAPGLYLDCPKMKRPIGSNIRKTHHVLTPVEQQFRTQSVLFMRET